MHKQEDCNWCKVAIVKKRKKQTKKMSLEPVVESSSSSTSTTKRKRANSAIANGNGGVVVVGGGGGGSGEPVVANAEQLHSLRRVLYAVLSDEEERSLVLERYFVCDIVEPEQISQMIA
jgi:hypothetical protein